MVQKYEKTPLTKNGLDFLFRFKGDACRIHAVTFPRNSRAVVENVTLVTAAIGANNFNTYHSQAAIFSVFNSTLDALVVAGPAATAIKFRFAAV